MAERGKAILQGVVFGPLKLVIGKADDIFDRHSNWPTIAAQDAGSYRPVVILQIVRPNLGKHDVIELAPGVKAVGLMLKDAPDYLLCDALRLDDLGHIEQEAIIKGDQKVYSISCASILAKVTRDNLMSNLGGSYNLYDFEKHKGYGTKLHQEKLRQYGVSDIHRKSYKPVRALLGE